MKTHANLITGDSQYIDRVWSFVYNYLYVLQSVCVRGECISGDSQYIDRVWNFVFNYLFVLRPWNSGIKFRQALDLCLFIFEEIEIWLHKKFNLFQSPTFPRSVKMKKT